MKRFVFNLQKLLQLREFEEKNAKTALAAAIGEAERIKLDLRGLAAERVRVNKTCSGTIDIHALTAVENYVRRLDVHTEELCENLNTAETLIEQRRAAFFSAMQKRSVLDKLKEKKVRLWRKENAMAEERAVEDAVYGAEKSAP